MRLRDTLIELLEAPEPDRKTVLAMVRALDLAWRADRPGVRDFIEQAVCRMVIAGAPLYFEAWPRARPAAEETLRAARAFVATPGEDEQDALFRAATNSFPFGPGDGCFAVSDLGTHGTPGAGCVGGVGCIDCLAPAREAPRLVAAWQAAVLPWLSAS